jgi:hypothetical protein
MWHQVLSAYPRRIMFYNSEFLYKNRLTCYVICDDELIFKGFMQCVSTKLLVNLSLLHMFLFYLFSGISSTYSL